MEAYTVPMGTEVLTAQVCTAGEDLNVTVFGGQRPHVGCVCLAVPRPSLTGDGSIRATVSVLNRTGHKDDEIAVPLARALAQGGNRVCVVTCGIHVDHLTAQELEVIQQAADRLSAVLLAAYGEGREADGADGLL